MTTVETNRNVKSKLGNLRPSNLDVLCVATVLGIVAAWLATPRFSPDSWSYFELSKTVFTDFYRINTYRQFQTVSPYGTSFPPLYPSLLAVGRAVCDVGIYTGVFLNAALCVATLFVVKSLARVSGLPAWVGNILFLALLLRPTYVDELMAARSIPLALLLVTAILRVYVSPALTPSRAVLMGFLAGLAVLTRFDFLAAAVFLGLVLAWYARKRAWLVSPVYFAALAVAVSPWVVYSLVHFSKPFVSDNSRTAMLVARSFVTDYYPHQEQLEYAWDAPLSWASNVIVRRFPRILDSWLKTITTDPTLAVLTGILVGIGVAARARPGCLRRDGRDQRSGGYVAQWRGFAAVLAVQLLTIGVTGYPDGRYLLPLQFFLGVVLALGISTRVDLDVSLQQWSRPGRQVLSLLCVAATVLLAISVHQVLGWKARLSATGTHGFRVLDHRFLSPNKYAGRLLKEIHRRDEEPRILIVSGVNPYQFGALTGCVTLAKPRNLTADTFIPFVKTYDVTHILDTQG